MTRLIGLLLALAVLDPSAAQATSCSPVCDCPVFGRGQGGRDSVLFPVDGASDVPSNVRPFVALPGLDPAAITWVETASGTPVSFTIEPSSWSASHVWIVPDAALRGGLEYTLTAGSGEGEASTFAVSANADDRVPELVQLRPGYREPCNEVIFADLSASAFDSARPVLFHFIVEGPGLSEPAHFFRTDTGVFADEAYLLLGRSLDAEGCIEDTLPEAEAGAQYDVRLEVYDLAGQLGPETPSLRVTTEHKGVSPDSDRTCVAGCCVLSVGGRASYRLALLTALGLAAVWWRRRRAAA